jgi:hypothetical protein
MVERLFFDRVNRFSADFPVRRGIQCTLLIFPDAADPVLPLTDLAAVAAQRALHCGIFNLCILARFVHDSLNTE